MACNYSDCYNTFLHLEYVELLLAEVITLAERHSVINSTTEHKKDPPNLCDSYDHPNKKDAIQQHCSRFKL